MDELRAERAMLYELLPRVGQGTIQLRPWVFEHSVLATDEKDIHTNYMDVLQASALYIGLFWNKYGDFTIEEFQQAKDWDLNRTQLEPVFSRNTLEFAQSISFPQQDKLKRLSLQN